MPEETPQAEPVEETDADESLESQAVEKEGKRLVPLPALKEERTKRQAAESRAREFEEKAKKAEQLEQFAATVQPLLDALKGRPEMIQKILNPDPEPDAPKSQDDEMMAAIAQTLDLYDASGKPDVKRVKPLKEWIASQVQSGVNEVVAPVAKGRIEDKALANYQWMLNQTDSSGRKVDKTIIDNVVSRVSREDLANADMAPNLWMMAYGAQQYNHAKGKVPAPGQEPVMVESPGGGSKVTALSEQQKRLVRESGRSEADVLKDLQKAVELGGVVE